jgi:hypothetical protein
MNSFRLQNAAPRFSPRTLEADKVSIYITLLERLENSLAVSQKALLSLDVAAVELGTREQENLYRQIQVLFTHATASMPNDDHAEKTQSGQPISSANWPAKLRATQTRILHLGRVQVALLSRAQRALNFVAHLKALSETIYAAPKWQAYTSHGTAQLK